MILAEIDRLVSRAAFRPGRRLRFGVALRDGMMGGFLNRRRRKS